MSLLDLDLKWKDEKGNEVIDEQKEKLKSLTFDSGEFVGMAYYDDNITLSKQSVKISCDRRWVGKGKDAKLKFFITTILWIEKYGDELIVDEWKFDTLESLEDCFNGEKERIEYQNERFKEGIIFDNHRYWRNFEYRNKILYLGEIIV